MGSFRVRNKKRKTSAWCLRRYDVPFVRKHTVFFALWTICRLESFVSRCRPRANSSSQQHRRLIPQHNNAFRQTTPTRTHHSTRDAGGHGVESQVSHKSPSVIQSVSLPFVSPLLTSTHTKREPRSVNRSVCGLAL